MRHGKLSSKSRPERIQFKRTLKELLLADDEALVHMLLEDRILQDKRGTLCPVCCKKNLGELRTYAVKDLGPRHRCSGKKCRAYILPYHGHHIFNTGHGSRYVSLQDQAATLFNAVAGAPHGLTHKQLGVNHKTVDRIYAAYPTCLRSFVE